MVDTWRLLSGVQANTGRRSKGHDMSRITNPALELLRMSGGDGDTVGTASAFAFALGDLVTLTEIRSYRPELSDALRSVRYQASPILEWQPQEDVCPACGELPDYCQGHGEVGDPLGADVLAAHDADDHTSCVRACSCGDSSDSQWPDSELQADYNAGTFDDDQLDYATRVTVRYMTWLNSPHAGTPNTYGRDY